MKRLIGIGVVIAILIAAVSSHGVSKTGTTAASEPATPAAPVAQSGQATDPHPAPQHYAACDQNISVGPHTTCGFADNVFRAFATKISAEGSGSAEYTVTASSPATGKTYEMSCRTTGGATRCEGGKGASVTFPLHAAQVYEQSAPQNESTHTERSEEQGEEPENEPEEPEAGSECTNGTYENSAGNTVCRPEESSSGPPPGATAECADGTYSFSESRSGTCSYHGGVKEWL